VVLGGVLAGCGRSEGGSTTSAPPASSSDARAATASEPASEPASTPTTAATTPPASTSSTATTSVATTTGAADRSGLDQRGYARLGAFIDHSRVRRTSLGRHLTGACADGLTSTNALPAFGRCVAGATRSWRADFDRTTAATAVPLRRRASGGCLLRWREYDHQVATYEKELASLRALAVPASAAALGTALGAYVGIETGLRDAEEEVYAACTPDP
jgi:hypothetical protein